MKNTGITEAETVNACTKFIIKDIAQQHVGKNIEKQLISLSQKQDRDTHQESKVMGAPRPSEMECNKEVAKSFI